MPALAPHPSSSPSPKGPAWRLPYVTPRSVRTRGICTATAIRRPPRVSRPLLSALASSWVPLRIYIEEILSALCVLGEWISFRREEHEVTRTSYPKNSPVIGKNESQDRPI